MREAVNVGKGGEQTRDALARIVMFQRAAET